MVTQVKMPQLGETVVEGTITRWLKQQGESVDLDESLVEVSTDKVDSEIPSPTAGTVSKILAQEGETVGVGALIAEIAAPGESAEEAPAEEAPARETAGQAVPQEAETPEPAGPRAGEPPVSHPAPAAGAPREPATTTQEGAEVEATLRREDREQPAAVGRARVPSSDEPRRGILSPLVRRMAAEGQVDLEQVRGTGTGGRITKRDVLSFIESRSAESVAPAAQEAVSAPEAPGFEPRAAPPQPPAPPAAAMPAPEVRPRPAAAGEEIVQVAHMRKLIADHMVKSHLETARAWNAVEVDMSRVARLRELAGDAFRQREGFSLTWMPFVSKAVIQCLLKYPHVNATWNGDGTITQKHFVNLGIAVALSQGLIVPVVKGADGMNVAGLARMIRDLADRARGRKLSPDEVQGGTFTITNPGPFGSIVSVPIINKGQAGILAFDAVSKRVVVVSDEDGNDTIAIRPMVFLSMSWDHRVIDGAEAAQFLSHLKATLEQSDFTPDLAGYLPSR